MSSMPNPYQAGAALPAEEVVRFEDASVTRRFWTFVIDWFATRLVILSVGVGLALFLGEEAIQNISWIEDFLLSASVYALYYVVLEFAFGRTLGKALLGTRVVNLHGTRPGLGAVVVRTLSRFIPLEPLSFSLADNFWHDSLSRTKVVRVGAPADISSKPAPLPSSG